MTRLLGKPHSSRRDAFAATSSPTRSHQGVGARTCKKGAGAANPRGRFTKRHSAQAGTRTPCTPTQEWVPPRPRSQRPWNNGGTRGGGGNRTRVHRESSNSSTGVAHRGSFSALASAVSSSTSGPIHICDDIVRNVDNRKVIVVFADVDTLGTNHSIGYATDPPWISLRLGCEGEVVASCVGISICSN